MIDPGVYTEGEEVLRAGFEAAETGLWVVNPPDDTLSQLISAFRDPPSPPAEPVRLFADREQLVELNNDFLLASLAAELVTEGRLAVRTLTSVPRCSLLFTERSVVSLVDCEGGVASLTATDDSVVRQTYEEYTERWERADRFSFRTPPLAEVRSTLASEVGPAVAEDFDQGLVTLERDAAGTDSALNGVSLALLVAATNGELLHDISSWGEEIRLASKATFSRTKQQLERAGLVDTEKVPIDVGRPRLRLVPADESPGNTDIEQVVRRARRQLE